MATRQVTGVISKVDAKPFEDRKTGEPITLYSFQLSGSAQWFRAGRKAIPAGVGQNVKFLADGANVDMTSFEVTQSEVTSAPAVGSREPSAQTQKRARSTGAYATGSGSKDDYWKEKEQRDIEKDQRYREVAEPRMALSVATQTAAQIVVAALQSDAIGFGNAAKSKRLGLLTAYVKEVAVDLAKFIQDAPEVLKNYKPVESTPENNTNNDGLEE